MSVEIAESSADSHAGSKPQNVGEANGEVNGVSNGHTHSSSKHKSSSKDKNRDKDRDQKSSKSGSSRDKDSLDKKHSSSSSSKDKHRDKDREKDRQRDKDRDKDRSDKHKSSSSSHKSSSRDKDKEREKDRQKEKTKEKSHDDKDKEREKNGEKDKEKKDRERNGDKDKDKDRRKDHKSSSNDKSRSDRHKSSSSSSKNKHSSSSSSSRHRDKSHHSSSKDRPIKDEKPKIFENGDEKPDIKADMNHIQMEPSKNDYGESCTGFENSNEKENFETKPPKMENEIFNMSQASSCDYSMSQFRKDEPSFDIKEEASDNEANSTDQNFEKSADPLEADDIGEDVPLAKRKSTSLQQAEAEDDDDDDEDDVPLAKRRAAAAAADDSDVPLMSRKKQKTSKKEKVKKVEKKKSKKVKREIKEEEDDDKPLKKKVKKEPVRTTITPTTSPTKRRGKAQQEEQEVWRWWEEEKRADGVKWNTLEHKGPVFAPPYEPLPSNVKFYYDGKEMKLSTNTEEAATFYAKMLNHDYVTKKQFNENFFKDFRKVMTSKEREVIKDLKKCNFNEMFKFFTAESEKRKNSSKEEKLARKEENEALIKEYGFCVIDGHRERIGNFKLEPPNLFRGRGEHPKMGMIKRRIEAEDVSINCAKDSKIPVPPPGHKWKEVRHDNTVTWLVSWTENVQGQVKYIMLNPSSKLKGEKDHVKYETARRLDKVIDKIRSTYRDEWKSKEMRVRQRAVALYFIDKLALRAGNEKDEDQADTVGCCSLRVEHVSLHKQLNGMENVVVFDFPGKDSIRYYNEVEVEKRVFKNLELFMENKKTGDDLFDRLGTQVLNEHLKELMDGLTAKVFRTYNASITLQNQLDLLTDPDASIPEKLLVYNRANRAVAILCNHQRSVPKGHAKSMETLKEKIRLKREQLEDNESEYADLKKAARKGSVKERVMADKKLKQIERLKDQLKKLELQETDRDENKTIALGTSKLNYLDPRISVAWCKKFGVPIEKIFNKTQREKFNWAIHMADENYRF